MSNETKSPASETEEQQKISPQSGELDAEKLDEVAGGATLGGIPPRPPPGVPPGGAP